MERYGIKVGVVYMNVYMRIEALKGRAGLGYSRGVSRTFIMGFPSVSNYRNIFGSIALISC